MKSIDLICEAIVKKQSITARYNGLERQLSPHILGIKNGRPQVLFYQFGGYSVSAGRLSPGSPDNWRCIPIEKLEDIAPMAGWYTSPNFSTQRQTCIDEVLLTADF